MRWTNLPLHLLVSAVMLGAAAPALAADDAPMPHRKHREGPDLDLGDDAAAPPAAADEALPSRSKHAKKHSKWWLKHHPKEAAAERAVGSGWQQEQGRGPGEPPKTPLVLALSRHLHVGTWDLAVLATAAEISTRFAALVRVANGADGGNPVCHLMVLSGNEDQPKTVEQDVRLHACPRGDEGADQTLLQPQPLGSVGAWLVRVIAGRYERKGRGVEMQQQWTMVAEMADGARVVFEHVATSFKGAADESFDQSETCTAPTVQFGQRGEPASARIGCDQLVRRDSYVRPSHHVYEYAWIDGQFVSR